MRIGACSPGPRRLWSEEKLVNPVECKSRPALASFYSTNLTEPFLFNFEMLACNARTGFSHSREKPIALICKCFGNWQSRSDELTSAQEKWRR